MAFEARQAPKAVIKMARWNVIQWGDPQLDVWSDRPYWEHTETAECTEGWEVDEYDFYSIWCTGSGEGCHPGCTEKRASNFDSTANVLDGCIIRDWPEALALALALAPRPSPPGVGPQH